MPRFIVLTAVLLGVLLASTTRADERADAIAREVVKASGGAIWPRVKILRFTFSVTEGSKNVVTARHVWDVKAGTDTVTWNNKTVTVNVWNPADDADSKAAFQRWTNDSYWLLAPLKLMDSGVTRAYVGERDGAEVIALSFQNIGLTPGDRYELHVDPDSHLIRKWVYMPNPDKKIEASWEEYQKIDGLTLSTMHLMGDRSIMFDRIDAELE